jgi:hypothetical protein
MAVSDAPWDEAGTRCQGQHPDCPVQRHGDRLQAMRWCSMDPTTQLPASSTRPGTLQDFGMEDSQGCMGLTVMEGFTFALST